MSRNYPLTLEEFQSIYSKVPRLTVDLIIQDDNGIILTLRQKNGWQNQWHLPGGTIYFKEKVEDAIRRVVQEELGIEVTIEKHIGYIEYPSEEKERGYGYTIALAFLCHPKSTNFILDDQVEKVDVFKTLPENTIWEQVAFLKKQNLVD
jgi:ADP-ribose pyrophosphatase YjhB (NUDIX family)